MFPRALSAAFLASLVLTLLSLARPAFAMPDGPFGRVPAGFCDDRGASAIALPPTLEAPEQAPYQAIRRAPASCSDDDLIGSTTISPEHRGRPRASAEATYAFIPVTPGLPGPRTNQLDLLLAVATPRDAIFTRVERPPRN